MTLPYTQPSVFDSTEVGAASLTRDAGGLLEVLRTCWVTGFNPKPITSISVSAGIATATAAAHGYTAGLGRLLLIAGVSDALLNGRKQPLSVTTNTFTFDAPGVADGTYTGTMEARRAPLGWAEAHTGVNTAIFARTAPEATSTMLRVDDTATGLASNQVASVSMVGSATDVDTVTNQVPTETSFQRWWMKGPNTTGSKPWAIVGDDRGVFVFLRNGNSIDYGFGAYFFGDIKPFDGVDPYHCFLTTSTSTSTSGTSTLSTASPSNSFNSGGISTGMYFQREINGIDLSVGATLCGGVSSFAASAQPATTVGPYPILGPFYVRGNTVRGTMPGLYFPAANKPFEQLVLVTPPGSDATFIALQVMTTTSQTTNFLIDITNPWR